MDKINKKATIYDYARICKFYGECNNCPFNYEKTHCGTCNIFMGKHPGKANEIILKWCEEHPVETRQDRFLKMFPNAKIDSDGAIDIAPCTVEKDRYHMTAHSCTMSYKYTTCALCRKEYWLAEVEE